jgi:hypothetical protein
MAYTGVANDEAVLNSVKIGGSPSTVVRAWGRISQSLTPVSVATVATVEQTFTVPGLAVGDQVTVTPPAITPGVAPVCARVSATNTLAVTFINSTAGALVPAAGVYQIGFVR